MLKKYLIIIIIFFNQLLPYPQNQREGISITSKGELKVLCVFAQFPDDEYDVNNPAWPKGKAPARLDSWIDESWTGTPRENTLTDYFNVMSLGKLHFIGKTVSVVTPHSRKFYLDNVAGRNFIHQEIFQELDKKMDFTEFDNWTNINAYNQINKPDGIVDMVLVIWRNAAMDLPNNAEIKNKLNMGWVADLATSVNVDNDKRTICTGATISDYFAKDPFRFTIHEFSHFLLGGNEFHNGHGFWAMCSGYEVRSFMINAFERYSVGWIDDNNLATIKYKKDDLSNVNLPDFITTGKACRIEIDSSKGEYFYLENHQKLSHWDKCSADKYPDDKGLFIIRQDYHYSNNGRADWMKLISAEGRYDFDVTQWAKSKWGPESLPVFKKGKEDKESGKFATEMMRETDQIQKRMVITK